MVDAAGDSLVMKSIHETIRSRRPLVIIVSAIIGAAVIVAGYTLLSNRLWSDYQTSYETWSEDARIKAEEALAPQLARADRLSQFKALTTSIENKKDSRCTVNGLIAWQQFMADNKKRQEECRRVADEVVAFGRQLQSAVSYLEDDQEITIILTDAIGSSDKLSQKQWVEQVATWGSASKSIAAADVVAEFTEVKTLASKRVATVEAAWKKIVAADKAKDESKYVDGEKDLTQAYAALKDISEESADHFKVIASKVQTAYDKAFINQ